MAYLQIPPDLQASRPTRNLILLLRRSLLAPPITSLRAAWREAVRELVAQCRIARCFTSDARKHPFSGSVTLSWELLRSYSSCGCFECSFYNASIYVWPLRSPWSQCRLHPETFVHLLGRSSVSPCLRCVDEAWRGPDETDALQAGARSSHREGSTPKLARASAVFRGRNRTSKDESFSIY
jgi:hypothetical protein